MPSTSDVQSIQTSVNGNTLIIYNNRKPDSYAMSDIYDPSDPQSGKYFPSLNSLVIDTDGGLYYVASRNENDYSVVLKPCRIVASSASGTDDEVTIVSYGNDKYCLYQDTRTDPHKLIVDAKFLIYGNNLVEYALYQSDANGNESCISMYFDSTGKFISNRIPLQSISENYPAYRFPTNCHTTYELTEGDPITLRAYNNLGNLAAEITLYVRNASWLNDLSSHTNPIVKLDAEALQMQGEDFYLYEKQDPSHLNIRPYLLYADGTKTYINVDNKQCFVFGLNDLLPSYAGRHQRIIIKYFLNYRETTTQDTSDNRRFLTCIKNILVLDNQNDYTAKLAVVPYWSDTYNTWKMNFFAYTDDRLNVYNVTDLVSFNKDYPFDGTPTKFGTEQHLVLDYDLQSIFQTNDPIPGAQSLYITFWDKTRYERYTFRDNSDDNFIYGVDGSITRRPIIHYDRTISQYFIPTSIFQNKEAVIESFYTLARPPYNPEVETVAPTPTHFTIRDGSTGQQIVGGPIPLEEYGQAWPTVIGTPELTGQTVLVEFLLSTSTTEFAILWGVPVDVREGTFNTADV